MLVLMSHTDLQTSAVGLLVVSILDLPSFSRLLMFRALNRGAACIIPPVGLTATVSAAHLSEWTVPIRSMLHTARLYGVALLSTTT